jgi:hypothetical protein
MKETRGARTRIIAGLLGAVLLAGCGATRSQADQQKDGTMLAGALRAADQDGMSFSLDQQLQITGGDIPSGQALQLHATASGGVLRNGTAQFAYRIQQSSSTNQYDMRVVGGRLYVRKHGASGWKATPVSNTTTLFPALRLDVVRETVLLATSVSTGALNHINAGFARKYAVQPGASQVEQLLSVSVEGAAEQKFLKSASGELDVYLTVPDNKLGRVEVHVSGVDPSNGEQQQIQSSMDLHSAKVAVVQAPADAQLVAASDILS